MKTEYFKCDLHIHTDHSNITKNSDYKGEFSLEKLVEKLESNNVKLFSLTDHNCINKDAYRKYYEKYSENDIKLLVGVEFDIHKEENLFESLDLLTSGSKKKHHKYHSLLIFRNHDVDSIDCRINSMYQILQDDYNQVSENNRIDFFNGNIKHRLTSLDRIVEAFRGEDFMIISHGDKSSSIIETYKDKIDEAQAMILLGVINSVEIGPKLQAITHFNSGFDKILKNEYKERDDVPYVVFSDNHELESYPNFSRNQIIKNRPFTWLRGKPCFETLRLSFVDPKSRIWLSGKEPPKPIMYLESIKFDTLNANGNSEHKHVKLSSGINTIIGGRSSGKSLLLNSILYNFVQSREKSEITKYQTDSNKVIDISSIKGKMNLNEEFLDNNNCSVLSYTQDQIVSLFDSDGSKLEQELPFIKYKDEDKSLIMKEALKTLDELATSYDDFYKNRFNKMLNITRSDLSISNSETSVVYHYNKAKKDIENSIKEDPSLTNKTIKKIEQLLENYDNISSLKFQNQSLFNSKEVELINSVSTMLKMKKSMLTEYYNNSSFKLSLLENIDEYINNELNNIGNDRDKIITMAKSRIDVEISKATNYINSKNKLYTSIKKLEDIELSFEPLEKDISSDYKLKTEIPYKLNKNSIYDFFKRNITGFDLEKPIESLLNMPYEDSNVRVFRKTNEPKDFYALINKLKNEIQEETIPKYSIVEKGVSRDLSSDYMSPGKKASVYLEIILTQLKTTHEPTILVIDQPEDNLDNLFITEKLVKHIRDLRGKVQVILATHNASVAINSDSDNIIIAENIDTIISYQNKGLENLSFREDVCKLLDGGHHTFDQRYHKYDIPNRKIYAPVREEHLNEV